MKREEFALSILINATSPCNAGRNQKRISEERTVPLSGVRLTGRLLWTWVTKGTSLLESSISSHNVAVIVRWDKHIQVSFWEFILNQAQRSAENLSAGGIFVLRRTEQCCSRAERRQLQGSFDQILPPDNLSGNCSSNICLPPGRDANGS